MDTGEIGMNVSKRIAALRQQMGYSKLAAYVVPSADPHQSEYVAATWKRRKFISGFGGSAGTVAVTLDGGGLWTDSRYFLQGEQELAGSGLDLFKMGEPEVPELEAWLADVVPSGERVGVDPKVFSAAGFDALAATLKGKGVELVPVTQDLVERVWGTDRPAMPDGPLRVHSLEFAGETVESKLERIAKAMSGNGTDAYVLAALDELAWVFNLRGSDVNFNPVFIAFAVVEPEGARLFVDLHKVGTAEREALPANVILQPYGALDDYLASLGESKAAVWIDPGTVNAHVRRVLNDAGAGVVELPGAIAGWKAAKNEAELTGFREAHVRDGASMVRFLRWLGEAVGNEELTEMSVWDKLKEFRRVHEEFIGLSFNSIVGFAGHGAIVHYAVSEESNIPVTVGDILLVDSGGQYVDGTTDITRTVILGVPSAEQKHAYTAVLQGHLSLKRSQFLEGTNGYQLDMLARAPLWQAGLNYGHGTGHGVGAALCVHEGPFSVSPRKVMAPLTVGNVLSNEPGYYKADSFGIRVENLVTVVEREVTESGRFLGFEDLTLCPYDRNLIDDSRLSDVERSQIDTYHAQVQRLLSPLLEGDDLAWLVEATASL